jgi:hypothetical protein
MSKGQPVFPPATVLEIRPSDFALNDVRPAEVTGVLPVESSGRTADYRLATFGQRINANSHKAGTLVPDP